MRAGGERYKRKRMGKEGMKKGRERPGTGVGLLERLSQASMSETSYSTRPSVSWESIEGILWHRGWVERVETCPTAKRVNSDEKRWFVLKSNSSTCS